MTISQQNRAAATGLLTAVPPGTTAAKLHAAALHALRLSMGAPAGYYDPMRAMHPLRGLSGEDLAGAYHPEACALIALAAAAVAGATDHAGAHVYLPQQTSWVSLRDLTPDPEHVAILSARLAPPPPPPPAPTVPAFDMPAAPVAAAAPPPPPATPAPEVTAAQDALKALLGGELPPAEASAPAKVTSLAQYAAQQAQQQAQAAAPAAPAGVNPRYYGMPPGAVQEAAVPAPEPTPQPAARRPVAAPVGGLPEATLEPQQTEGKGRPSKSAFDTPHPARKRVGAPSPFFRDMLPMADFVFSERPNNVVGAKSLSSLESYAQLLYVLSRALSSAPADVTAGELLEWVTEVRSLIEASPAGAAITHSQATYNAPPDGNDE